MSYCDLLDRMKCKDTEAFLEMTDRYGWSVYSAIREKYSDQATADKIYNETMNGFYHALSASTAEDPLEALLCGFAEQISPDQLIFDRVLPESGNVPPTIQLCHGKPCQNAQTTVPKKNGFLHHLGVFLGVITMVFVLWFLLGLLMEMDLIVFFDLGYSWFCANVLQFL